MPLKISRAELEVMKTLWKKDDQTASEIHSLVSKHKDWSIRTVKTPVSYTHLTLPTICSV